eukprot:1156608-Pelagomonas_calceolata.AAC.4
MACRDEENHALNMALVPGCFGCGCCTGEDIALDADVAQRASAASELGVGIVLAAQPSQDGAHGSVKGHPSVPMSGVILSSCARGTSAGFCCA